MTKALRDSAPLRLDELSPVKKSQDELSSVVTVASGPLEGTELDRYPAHLLARHARLYRHDKGAVFMHRVFEAATTGKLWTDESFTDKIGAAQTANRIFYSSTPELAELARQLLEATVALRAKSYEPSRRQLDKGLANAALRGEGLFLGFVDDRREGEPVRVARINRFVLDAPAHYGQRTAIALLESTQDRLGRVPEADIATIDQALYIRTSN